MLKQKIVPCLWFENQAEEAMKFYTRIFPNSSIVKTEYYPEGYEEGPLAGMNGKVINGLFELSGLGIMCLDGGPTFKFNPAVSFFVNCKSADEVEEYYNKLVDGGTVMMPLEKYDFSERYAWIADKYGVSWQINVGESKEQHIVPALMFVGREFGKAEEAIDYYVEVFKNASAGMIARYSAEEGAALAGKIKYAEFKLANLPFVIMESNYEHQFEMNESISFYIDCVDQEEVDYFWGKLSSVPEAEQCGWAKDRFGVSWQVVPEALEKTVGGENAEGRKRAMDAMMQMKKLDVQKLWDAYNGA